jgi:signal transduction histidine kinase
MVYPGQKKLMGHMIRRQYSFLTAAAIFGLLICVGCQVALAAESKRVMLLHSFGRDFKPWSEYAREIRTELIQQSPWALEITDNSLVTARSSNETPEVPFVQYLRALFAEHPLDLIVCIGAPAAAFMQRHRHELFSNTPMVLTAVDERRVQSSGLSDNDSVVAARINHFAALENVLRVLPDTKNVTVVVGTSPTEKFWKDEIAKAAEPLTNRLTLLWTDHLSFEELLKHAAALPSQSAIFWELMIIDAAGVVHEGDTALARLHKVANAPIFSHNESFFGREIVGGPLLLIADISRQTAAVAVRILGGEKAGDIKIPPIGFATPKFDWREMQRWGISEKNLPPGSEIYFREPSLWDQYRVQILLIFVGFLLQSALICWLIFEHRRRHLAEIMARNSMSELTHMNRVATAGELSASIAHEVNQPLTGIVTRASAARRWLTAERPDIDKARAALDQIEASGHRAAEIIKNLKSMFRKDTTDKSAIDINKLIWNVLGLVYIDLRKHQIDLQSELADQLPPVLGNQVQLQQVILNLIMNAIDSMRSVDPRVLSVRSKLKGRHAVQVSIEDTGIGIDPANVHQIFNALFTTKQNGMGMGLSICRSIIESHDGRIWVSPGINGGSIFQFELPIESNKNKVDTMAA